MPRFSYCRGGNEMTKRNLQFGDRPRENETRTSTSNESWLFAQALLGNPIPRSREPGTNTNEDPEYREFLAAITTGRATSRTSEQEHREWLQAISTSHERSSEDLQETKDWVASITTTYEGEWDPAKHPRGGFPENPGWFSPSGGGGQAPSHSGGREPSQSWPEPVAPEESHPSYPTNAPDRAPHAAQVAFQPPPRQDGRPVNKDGVAYNTPDEAARQALRNVTNKSQQTRREYGGAIYEKDGKYYYTDPEEGPLGTPGKRQCKIILVAPGKVVATYHTHIDDPLHSPGDKFEHDKRNIPSYVAKAGNKIQRYTPDPKKTARGVPGRGKVVELPP
jgi:hypothetical protein